MLSWLQRILGLPRLSWRSVLPVYLFMFLGQPMLATVAERVVDHFFPDAGAGGSALIFFSIFVALLAVAWAAVRWGGLFNRPSRRSVRNPDAVKLLVMLASDKVPDGPLLAEILAIQDEQQLFKRFQSMDGPYRWLEVVVRAVEWHKPKLETLLLLASEDGLGKRERSSDQEQLIWLLDHYVRICLKKTVDIQVSAFGHSCDPDQMFREVEKIQRSNRDASEVIFDFTGGTKPMSAGMVMACLDDRFNLQYFPQMMKAPEPRFKSVARGWGQLPIEKQYGLTGGVLPILVETDADGVRESLG